jgi:hypothetical protein
MSSQPQIPRHREIDPKRLRLQNIAQETIHTINDGCVNFQDVNNLDANDSDFSQ